MTRFALLAALVALATPTFAADKISKEDDCAYQADVVGAIQTARMDRVRESKLAEAIAATEPTWPEQYNNAITILSGPIYQLKRRDLKGIDLSAQWKEACLSRE
jgi:hypothetical protein